ncbi:MAG: ABC transporter ATP-binding protein [Armatimonadota bacterium]|nr:ABC transporter ATP-binding protein [Armatimonadota bacterium]
MIDVALEHVTKRFGHVTAVERLSLEVRRGEFLTLLGPSGCGKTTTLNMVAGFLDPDEGAIVLRGRPVTFLPPYERDTGMVFQNYALFPHMTVYENVAFGLRMRRVRDADVRRRVHQALDQVHLAGLGDRYPRQLSGGQQQRVALARAIVTEPAVLLLDEPLSNLDLKLREAMRLELKALQHRLGLTTVYVTHDQSEALVMSDRVVVMHRGRVEQVGSPLDIYERPATPFVADFIGTMNTLPVAPVSAVGEDGFHVVTSGGARLRLPGLARDGARLLVAIRPEKCRLSRERPAADNAIPATVADVVYLGTTLRYQVTLQGGDSLLVDDLNVPSALLARGEAVWAVLPPEHCLLLDAPK